MLRDKSHARKMLIMNVEGFKGKGPNRRWMGCVKYDIMYMKGENNEVTCDWTKKIIPPTLNDPREGG